MLQHVRDRARTLSRGASTRRQQTLTRSADYIVAGEEEVNSQRVATPPMERRLRTLRNGAIAFGQAVGQFFGVTEDSQAGNNETVGWAEIAQQSAQVCMCMCVIWGS